MIFYSGTYTTFYIVKTTRLSDNVTTTVHRRFRDFADMNSAIKQNLKGHQMWSSLPSLPEKTLKVCIYVRVCILFDILYYLFLIIRLTSLSFFTELMIYNENTFIHT